MTVQVGTVLLFAILIVLLSTYQATIVPQQNEQVEYNHNQQVQGQLQDLRDDLLQAGVTGSGGSSSVALGTQFPVRAIFVNPPAPSGTLRTTPPATVTIENATASGETGDYWTGAAHDFSTRGLAYAPNYRVYQNAPTTIYDNGVLYNRFEDANVTLAGQRLVRGNRISLVTLNGSLSKSGSGSTTVDFQAVSPATRTVTVRNETSNLSLVLPTTRPASEWTELLSGELNQTKGDDRYVLAVEEGPRENTVRVVLEPGTYELELAKVGVSTDATGVEPHYLTDVEGDDSKLDEGDTRELVVEVRDRYNNPVSGVEVNASTSATNSSVAPTTATTDDSGRVGLTYTAPANVTGVANLTDQVQVSYELDPGTASSFDAETRQNLTMDVLVRNADRSGLAGNETEGEDINPVRDGAVIVQNEQVLNKQQHLISFEFNNTGRERNVTSARINFYYSSQTGGGTMPRSADFRGPNGNTRATLEVGGGFVSLTRNGGPITLANQSVTTLELDFSGGSLGNSDFVVVTVIFDDGEASATYFIAPPR